MGGKIPGPIEGVFVTKMIKSFHTYIQMYEIFFFLFFFHFWFGSCEILPYYYYYLISTLILSLFRH